MFGDGEVTRGVVVVVVPVGGGSDGGSLDGGGGEVVVKVWSAPGAVPDALCATSSKWYIVPDARPVTGADAGTLVVPVPAGCGLVSVP
jgi:hypothetical protein